jgi:hypothetical protein
LSDFQLQLDNKAVVEVIDTYGATLEGRPTSLARSFETISERLQITWDFGGSSLPGKSLLTGASQLTDTSVTFTWDEDQYAKAFCGRDQRLDPELLESLREDVDLRCLLQVEDPVPGEWWELELTCLPQLLAPGGYPPLDFQLDGVDVQPELNPVPRLMGELLRELSRQLEGEATVEFTAVKQGLAELELDIHARSDRDLAELFEQFFHEELQRSRIELESMQIVFDLELQGTAHWDLERGRLADLELEGEVSYSMYLVVPLRFKSRSRSEAVIDLAMTGTFQQTIEFEERE